VLPKIFILNFGLVIMVNPKRKISQTIVGIIVIFSGLTIIFGVTSILYKGINFSDDLRVLSFLMLGLPPTNFNAKKVYND